MARVGRCAAHDVERRFAVRIVPSGKRHGARFPDRFAGTRVRLVVAADAGRDVEIAPGALAVIQLADRPVEPDPALDERERGRVALEIFPAVFGRMILRVRRRVAEQVVADIPDDRLDFPGRQHRIEIHHGRARAAVRDGVEHAVDRQRFARFRREIAGFRVEVGAREGAGVARVTVALVAVKAVHGFAVAEIHARVRGLRARRAREPQEQGHRGRSRGRYVACGPDFR